VLNNSTWWSSYRSTTPNPSNHLAIEVGKKLTAVHEWNAIWRLERKRGGLGANLKIVTSISKVITEVFLYN
jgi:hypothetical protein